jgi:hypothetical protein
VEGYSWVKARNIGLPPSGFTIGKRALRINTMFLAASSKRFLRMQEYSRVLFIAAPEPHHEELSLAIRIDSREARTYDFVFTYE